MCIHQIHIKKYKYEKQNNSLPTYLLIIFVGMLPETKHLFCLA